MLTKDYNNNNKKQSGQEKKRDLELENIVGNLLVAEYQVNRLRGRLTDIVSGYRATTKNNKVSTHIFKHNDRWYKISLRIDKTDLINSVKEDDSNKFTDSP
jgi:hypothetical protein